MSPPDIRYVLAKMTWEDVNEAVLARKVVLLPVGAIEQHGPHLPVDTDNLSVTAICERASAEDPELLVCAPPIHYGFNEHNMDFPGTVTVDPEHFVHYCTDVAKSFGRMGFRRVLLVNGHGSNAHLLEQAARMATLFSPAKVATVSYWALITEEFAAIRQSPFPGGTSHACEFETSTYLYLDPAHVKRDRIVPGIRSHTRYFWEDLMGASPVKFTDWRSTQTDTGIGGDPTLATAEKGERIVKAAVAKIIEVAREFRDLPSRPRRSFIVTMPED
jgi:creatinine amidohydrolase